MKRSLLLLLTLFAFVLAGPVACKAKKQANPMEGSWIIDTDATIEQIDEDQREMAAVFIRMVKIGLTFDPAGEMVITTAMLGSQEEASGTYEVVSADGDDYVVEVTRAADPEAEVEAMTSQVRITFRGDDQILFRPVPQEGETEEDMERETLILKRVTAEQLAEELSAPTEQPSMEQLFGDIDVQGLVDAAGEEAAGEEAAGEEAAAEEAGSDEE